LGTRRAADTIFFSKGFEFNTEMQFGMLTLNLPRKFEREVLTGNIPDLGGFVDDCEQFGSMIHQSICRRWKL
jgi:hypothetical protein